MKSNFKVDSYNQNFYLQVICKPNLSKIKTKLELQIEPNFQSISEESKDPEKDIEIRTSMIEQTNKAFQKLTAKKSFENLQG